jgi:hypothetical protein
MDVIKYNSVTQEVAVIVHSTDSDREEKLYQNDKNSDNKNIIQTNNMNGYDHNHTSFKGLISTEFNDIQNITDNEVHCTNQNKITTENKDKQLWAIRGNSDNNEDKSLNIFSNFCDNDSDNDKSMQISKELTKNMHSSSEKLSKTDAIIPLTEYNIKHRMSLTKENSLSNENKNSETINIKDAESTPHNSGNRVKMLTGFILTCVSALFFSLTTVIVKYVEDVDPGEMASIRFLCKQIT